MFRTIILLNILFCSLKIMAAEHTIDLSQSTQVLKQKEQGMFVIEVKIKPQTQLNEEAPIKVELEKSKVFQFTKTLLGKEDIQKKEKSSFQFQIPFQALATGKHEIKGEIRFYMCSPGACKVIKEPLSIKIEVN